MGRTGFCLVAALALSCTTAAPDVEELATAVTGPAPTVVQVETGLLQGVIEGPVRAFRGIPYAAPPVGDLRFRTPRAPLPWTGTRDASAFGNICPQLDGGPFADFLGDEDCLTLNVFSEAAPPAHPLPVLIFFHGGGSRQGSSADPTFDAPGLTARHVVVVTVNYRLGGIGRLALPAFGRDLGHIGNWGPLDELESIRWVHRNIEAFGGDARRVMIFGESSGAGHVNDLLASPEARGLFHAAAMESGLGGAYTIDQAYAISEAASATLGCSGAADEAACMRALPAEAITRVTFVKGTFPPPVIDGVFLPQDPIAEVQDNGTVPLLIGTNHDEETTVLGGTSQPMTADEFDAQVRSEVGDDAADQLLPLYPLSDYATPRLAYIAFETDINFTCPTRFFARKAAQHGPVFLYLFSHVLENSPDAQELLAGHGFELPFVFGTLDVGYVPTTAERQLSDLMTGAWAAMARHERPDGPGLPHWPRTRPDKPRMLVWDDAPSLADGFHDAQCDMFEAVGQL
jgi:para-nitrobenzyl esterase